MVKRKIVKIDEEKCNGCGQCIPNCAEGALKIIDGKAKIVNDVYCDGLGACLGHCPEDAISIIEREAPDFDEEAVHDYLKSQLEAPVFSCPATQTLTLQEKNVEASSTSSKSTLRHWPVQLNLVPIKAPFWDDADLLLMADCVSVAYPDLHGKLLKGKSVMIGCPKFDDSRHYIEKLTEILKQNNVHSLTVAIMDVLCCNGLGRIAELALDGSGKMIPSQRLVITVQGEVRRA
ncbi:MAG: 4Fe-4S binding protein [Candidatus Bathyarchaeota archaeon]|nr:4Fe-4S binding protein [Candidatus Bathyarchaeota archaeon]